jgi:hypothetical protein
MPFGKYRSWPLADLPDEYVAWLLSLNDLREPLASAIRAEAHRRQVEEHQRAQHDWQRPDPNVVDEIVGAGVKVLARRSPSRCRRRHSTDGGNQQRR